MKIQAPAYEDKEDSKKLASQFWAGSSRRPGYAGGPDFVDRPMGLSVIRPTLRRIPEDSR